MKKSVETSMKARSCGGYAKHLKPYTKRLANKASRRIAKANLRRGV